MANVVGQHPEKPMEINVAVALKYSGGLMRAGQYEEAEQLLRAAVMAEPNDSNTIHALAMALLEQETREKSEEAVALLQHVGAMLRDEMIALSCNMGKALGELGRTKEAIASFQGVLRSYPNHTGARYGRGLMRMQEAHFKEAVEDFDQVIASEPDNGKALFARGFANLVLGNYRPGFRDYEFRRHDLIDQIDKPEWKSDARLLLGKTILVHGEQGQGDNIQFLRYITWFHNIGARVLLVLDPSMASLASDLGVTVLTTDRSTWPHFDCWIRMMSLAYAFATTMETVPPPLPLGITEKETNEFWGTVPLTDDVRYHREMYGRNSNARRTPKAMKIGLCWSGSPHSRYDSYRSIPLKYLEPLIRDSNARFYSLQLGLRDSDKETFSKLPITDLSPKLKSFRDTALAMAGLDLVITVDTSVAHLAGTVGVPTWVMLNCFRTYWVWIQGLDYSPWYPSTRVFQQKTNGDWPELIGRVQRELLELAKVAA
jgi:hypothetical protein